jgi:hypothetical protein
MCSRATKWFGLVGAVLTFSACRDLPQQGALAGGGVPAEPLPTANEVPAAWGRLVAVTETSAGNESMLWFQDDSGTVRSVGFNRLSRRLWSNAPTIRRR